MKILQLTPFYDPHLGGVETHVKFLNKELIKSGHEVSVLTQRHDANLPLQQIKDGVEIVRIDTETKHYSKLNYKLTVWQQIAKHSRLLLQADVIHVHDVYWWLLPVLPLFWSKTYLTFHGWEGKFPVPWKNKLARWLWSKLALKTIHIGDYIKEFYWDEPDMVIYGGVAVKKKVVPKKINKVKKVNREAREAALGHGEAREGALGYKKFQIVFVGRLELENDIEKYLSLAKKLKSILDIEIIWVGDGSYKEECQQSGVVTGMVNDLTSYIAKADLIWSASYLSILEAQALGKIVCSFYSHYLKELYIKFYPGSTYMLVEYKVEQMKKQIVNLIDNPQVFNRYSQQAQQWSSQQTWKKVADKYQQLWSPK